MLVMRRLGHVFSVCGVALSIAVSPSIAAPLKTMDAVGAAIRACWKPPAGSKDSFATLSFSFNRDGMLIGPPRPTAFGVPGDAQAQKQFVDAAVAAVERCVPLEFSAELADGIGGQVFTMEFTSQDKASLAPADSPERGFMRRFR